MKSILGDHESLKRRYDDIFPAATVIRQATSSATSSTASGAVMEIDQHMSPRNQVLDLSAAAVNEEYFLKNLSWAVNHSSALTSPLLASSLIPPPATQTHGQTHGLYANNGYGTTTVGSGGNNGSGHSSGQLNMSGVHANTGSGRSSRNINTNAILIFNIQRNF